MRRRFKRADWAPRGGSWSSWGMFQWPGIFHLRSVGSKPQAELPSLEHHSWKGTQITSTCNKHRGFCLPGRDGWRFREPLTGSTHKISFVATYLGSTRGRPEWTRDTWGESGAVGSGNRIEGTATKIPVLSYCPYCRSHLSQAEHSPPSGISLRKSNSSACRNYSAPPCST